MTQQALQGLQEPHFPHPGPGVCSCPPALLGPWAWRWAGLRSTPDQGGSLWPSRALGAGSASPRHTPSEARLPRVSASVASTSVLASDWLLGGHNEASVGALGRGPGSPLGSKGATSSGKEARKAPSTRRQVWTRGGGQWAPCSPTLAAARGLLSRPGPLLPRFPAQSGPREWQGRA